MTSVIVQFNAKKEGPLFSLFSNYNVNEIDFSCKERLTKKHDEMFKSSEEEISKVLSENEQQKIILVLHDKNLGTAFIFTNETSNRKLFKKNTAISIDNCDALFKRIHVVKVNSEHYIRVHNSPIFDYYYMLLKIDEDYGIPKNKLISDKRDLFLREKDRVLYSDMYKRLVDKAQIYSARKSIYVRNRLSHTNEVASISESICVAFNDLLKKKNINYEVNLNLVRTIALAHDIGHTPFGHAGERAIEDFLSNYKVDFKYFKHNYNGVRALTYLEESYNEYYGLNLHPEVCAGVLAHTSFSKKHQKQHVILNEFKQYIGKYFNYYDSNYNDEVFKLIGIEEKKDSETGKVKRHLYCKFIEGQIVAFADEIAQKGHDIEDSILTGIVSVKEILAILQSYVDYNGKDNNVIKEIYREIRKLEDYQNYKISAKRITSIIINKLINDLVNSFDSKINKFKASDVYQDDNYIYTDYKVVDFTAQGIEFIKIFESFTFSKIICSKEVVSYDKHGDNIIKNLLQVYVNDVRLLPKDSLDRMNIELYKTNKDFMHDFTMIDVEMSNFIRDAFKKPVTEYEKQIVNVVIREIVDFVSSVTDTYAEHLYEDIFKTTIKSY